MEFPLRLQFANLLAIHRGAIQAMPVRGEAASVAVRPLPDYRIYVEIEDGRKGIFDVKPYLDLGVFRELKDVSYFNQVGIVLGAITWPNEQDIAPETLLAEMVPAE